MSHVYQRPGMHVAPNGSVFWRIFCDAHQASKGCL